MKKLMIAAAAAAMIGGAFADAQVYEYKLNLTTTTCKEGKVAKNTYWTKALDKEAGDDISYRTKTSLVIQGLTWGCSCSEALAGRWGKVCSYNKTDDEFNASNENWFGITFWSKKSDSFLGGAYDGAMFDWDEGFINRIGKKANEVEFTFALVPNEDCATCEDAEDEDDGVTPDQLKKFSLTLAGMGSITDNLKAVADDDEDGDVHGLVTDCDSYIKSAKGSVAGYVNPDEGIKICTYCDEEDIYCEINPFCGDCDEDCDDEKVYSLVTDEARTVAFGTFTMKYNASASKKLKKQAKITKSYTGFSKNVKAALVAAGE